MSSHEREDKIQIPALLWAFVFGFVAGKSRTLAVFRRSYNSTADKILTAGGFYHWLTPRLADFLCDLVKQRLDEVAVPHTINDEFDHFRDTIVADGTILRLHELPAKEFQPRRREQGGTRLHLLHNVTDYTIDQFSITDEKAHDSNGFDTGPWLKDRLVLFDQAYFKYRRFALIDENGGFL